MKFHPCWRSASTGRSGATRTGHFTFLATKTRSFHIYTHFLNNANRVTGAPGVWRVDITVGSVREDEAKLSTCLCLGMCVSTRPKKNGLSQQMHIVSFHSSKTLSLGVPVVVKVFPSLLANTLKNCDFSNTDISASARASVFTSTWSE